MDFAFLYTKLIEYVQKVQGTDVYVFVWLVLLILLAFLRKKDFCRMVLPYIFVIIAIANPVMLYAFLRFMDDGSLARLFWCLLFDITVAAASTTLVFKAHQKAARIVIAVLLAAVIAKTGTFIMKNGLFEQAANPYKIKQETIDVVDMVHNISTDQPVILPVEMISEARQYDGTLVLRYGRYSAETERIELYLDQGIETLTWYFNEGPGAGAACLVLPANDSLADTLMVSGHWGLTAEVDGYYIYAKVY